MYSFELDHLQADNIQSKVLGIVESICEEFLLQDHFGTISICLHELIECILVHVEDHCFDASLQIIVAVNHLSVTLRQTQSLQFLQKELLNEEPREDASFIISQLSDKIDFYDDQTIGIVFHVKPKRKGMSISQNENIQNLNCENEEVKMKKTKH